MQKKLYFLNEEEKNRILNLHESRTKKQYLISEQEISGVSQEAINKILSLSKKNKSGFQGIYLFPTQQKEIDVEFGSGTYQKFLNNGGEKLLQGQGSTSSQPILSDLETKLWNGRNDRVKQLDAKCGNSKPKNDDPIYVELGNWFNEKLMSLSWGTGTLENILNNIKTVEQYCQISSTLKNSGTPNKGFFKESIGELLKKYIKKPKSWIQYFETPLKPILASVGFETIDSVDKKSVTSTDIKTSDDTSWKNYPCITSSKNVVKVTLKNGSTAYKGGGFVWYNNGRNKNVETGVMGNYHCGDDGKVKEGLKPTTKDEKTLAVSDTPVATGIGAATRSVNSQIPTLLQQAGIEGTSLTQDTINKLYDKLSKKV